MRRCSFTRRAVADLEAIARYTKTTWGAAQAGLYREELALRIEKLALSPGVGRLREDIAPEVRSFAVARHIVFYIAHDARITVLRVLHPSMDVEGAFTEGDGR